MIKTRSRLAVLACFWLWAIPSRGFVRNRNASGTPTRRGDAANIRFLVNDQTRPGLTNSSGAVTITADSDPIGALQAALDAWTEVPTSGIVFAALTPTSLDSSQADREHILSFADNPSTRSIVGDAVAVTRTFTSNAAEIIDTDILFNPNLPFSTTLQAGTFDIQTVATHEVGHALGASHSGLVSATMFFAVRRGVNQQATLTPDDVAFATEVYPETSAGGSFGSITGTVQLSSGGGVRGALVTALDPTTGAALGSITGADGSYTITPVPPGRYFVYAEPADGPVEPNQLGAAGQGANTNFLTAVLGGAENPQSLPVTAGSAATADLTVDSGAPPLNVRQGGSGAVGGSVTFGTGSFVVNQGATMDLILAGEGLDDQSITADTISFLGAPIVIQGPVRRSVASGSGLPVIRITVQVAANAPLGLASVLVRSAAGVSVFSGGIRIAPATPSFTPAGVVNGASFAGGPAAPGEIVSIFGAGLGPAGGQVGRLNPGTNRLNTTLGGVFVTFNGSRAPLFFVSGGQINAQVPFEVAGQSTANVVVSYGLAASQPVSIPIGAAHPGIFTVPGSSQGIIQNQDGTLNSPTNQVPRGQAIVIYATGQGAINPTLPTGALAIASPLSGAAQNVTATIGDRPAQVLFAGLTPFFVGLLQVNVLVPNDAPTGASVPVSINVGGLASQPNVTLAVR
jgi:uncharacterized protein (TIGR03437 family)